MKIYSKEEEEKRKKDKEIEMLKTQIEDSKMREDEAKRAVNTVFMTSLPLKANEKDIYNFIKENNVGKIRDIKLIREIKTKRSKGIAYIEFYYFESVTNALSLNNKRFMGQNIFVTRSQSDKNRGQLVTRAPKPMIRQTTNKNNAGVNQKGIIIKNLVNDLAKMNQEDMRRFFGSFGDIEYIDMDFDPQTGLNKGYAIILYTNAEDAKAAIKKMNGLKLSGEVMMVSHVPSYMCLGSAGDDEGGSRIASKTARLYMISKLARGEVQKNLDTGKPY